MDSSLEQTRDDRACLTLLSGPFARLPFSPSPSPTDQVLQRQRADGQTPATAPCLVTGVMSPRLGCEHVRP